MALDGIYLSLIKRELSEALLGARVDRIHQPARESLVITFRTQSGTKKLLMNSSAGSARVHLTLREPENPQVPPMFCMLLRKHIGSGKLVNIRQDGFERILFLDFEASDELGDRVSLTLAVEIMGRCSNIVLISPEGRVIDSIKRVGEDMSRVRPVLPGTAYSLPPREKRLDPLDFDPEELLSRLSGDKQELSKALVKAFEGISPIFAREAAFFACRGEEKLCSELSGDNTDRLLYFLKDVKEKIARRENVYCLVKDKNGLMKDFSFIKINQYGGLTLTKEYDTPSALLDGFYTERDALMQTKQRADDLFRVLTSLNERVRRRVASQKIELEECKNRDEYRIKGDLITANLYAVERGMTKITVPNFYEEGSPEVEIALDPRLTPSMNAQKYYSEYRKADTAEKMLRGLIEKGESEIKYLESVFDSLSRATAEAELYEIREELKAEGYLRSGGKKVKAPKALPPIRYRSTDGFLILSGRNNRQNDRLTLRSADRNDLWFHVKDITGSHVVLVLEGREPTEEGIFAAAKIAAYNSSAKNSSNVPVDYTRVRFVKKPAGAKPGMVIYTDQKTVYVTPDGDEAESMKEKKQ